ncbi:hypothetical protein [Azospirillum sp.]|nr:hypothetical protein [Azospirillum sp.]
MARDISGVRGAVKDAGGRRRDVGRQRAKKKPTQSASAFIASFILQYV